MIYSTLEFRNLFTHAEKQAIYGAMSQSIDIRIWLDDLAAAVAVDTAMQQTIATVQSLEAAGLIAAGRAAQILSTSSTAIGTASVRAPFTEAFSGVYNILAIYPDGTAHLEGVGDFASTYYTRIT